MTDEEREKMLAMIQGWKEVDKVPGSLRISESEVTSKTLTELGGNWVATPRDYNSSSWMRFGSDGTAQFCYGYGQTVYAVVNAKFKVKHKNIIELHYLESPALGVFEGFMPEEANESKEFFIVFSEEPTSFENAVTSTVAEYRLKLKIDKSIFPNSIVLPDAVPLEFYGQRILNN
jgi:hypothetical protein